MTFPMHPAGILLFITILFQNTTPLFARESISDTTIIASFIDKAKKIEEQNPDSSIACYTKAINLCDKNLAVSLPREIHNMFMRKAIDARLSVALICYKKLDYETVLQYYQKAYTLSKELNNSYYIGECLFNFAEVYLEQSKYTEAMTNYYKAIQEYTKAGERTGIFWSYLGMGIAQKQCGNFDDAVICYDKARAIAEELGMKLETAYCLNNMGNVYRKQGNLPKAMENYEKALTCFTEMDDELSASDCMNNIGNLYLEKGDPFRALDYYNRSILSEKVKADNYRMISRYKNLADAYNTLKDYRNTSMFMDKAVKLAENSDDKLQLALCYSQIGKFYIDNGSSEVGISYLKKSVNLFRSIEAKAEEAESLVGLAFAELKTGNINDALEHAQQGEQLAADVGAIQILYSANDCLASIWEKKGDSHKSLICLHKAIELKDSIFSIEKNRAVEEVEAGFTRTRLENENMALTQEAELQRQSLRNRNIAMGSLFVSLLLSIIIIWLIYKRHNELKSIARREEALKQKEIDELSENLRLKERELTSKAVFLTQKNNLIEKIIAELNEMKNEQPNSSKIDRLQHELKIELSPNLWNEFEVQFNEVHPEFQSRLIERFPELSPMERRLCAFLKLDMNTREVAALTGQSLKSIEVARTRIRKKMDLSREDNLSNFIASL